MENNFMEQIETLLLEIREAYAIPSASQMSGIEMAASRLASTINRPDLDPDYDPEWDGEEGWVGLDV